MNDVDIEYEVIPLDNIINYYAKDYTAKEGEIVSKDYFVDVHKNVVVFRLYVKRLTKRALDGAGLCANCSQPESNHPNRVCDAFDPPRK